MQCRLRRLVCPPGCSFLGSMDQNWRASRKGVFMLGIDDVIEGAAFGVGAVAVGAMAVFGGPKAKPYAKRAMKGYMTVAHRAQEAAAEAAERVQDLYHEARHEYESEINGTSTDKAPA